MTDRQTGGLEAAIREVVAKVQKFQDRGLGLQRYACCKVKRANNLQHGERVFHFCKSLTVCHLWRA